MKKTPIFLIVLFFLMVLVPQVCAQTKKVSAEEAATMRTAFVEYSKRYIGKPYARGAIGPDAFDCSGLVFACSRESIGVQLPRQTLAMFSFCELIDDSEREVGDLVFFKTTGDGSVSHVGIYAGNNQFINCASDGPNTGVIISSLKENYWESHYFKTGRFLPVSGVKENGAEKIDASEILADSSPSKETSAKKEGSDSAAHASDDEAPFADHPRVAAFLSKIVLDATFNFDWNFYTATGFKLNPRGASSMMHIMYIGEKIKPGIGTMIRYDAGVGAVQIPLVISLTLGEYFRFFLGPVISFGDTTLPGDEDTAIDYSFLPGIVGICWQTPSLKVGKIKLSLQQDIHYTIFNEMDGSALSFKNGLVSGLVFSSGVRVTLPLASML